MSEVEVLSQTELFQGVPCSDLCPIVLKYLPPPELNPTEVFETSFKSLAEGTLLERLPFDLIPIIGYHFDRKLCKKMKGSAEMYFFRYPDLDSDEELRLDEEELMRCKDPKEVVGYMQEYDYWKDDECICYEICYIRDKQRMGFESQYLSAFCPLCIKQWEQIIEYDRQNIKF